MAKPGPPWIAGSKGNVASFPRALSAILTPLILTFSAQITGFVVSGAIGIDCVGKASPSNSANAATDSHLA